MTKIISSFIGGFIIGLIIIFGWNTYSNNRVSKPTAETTVPSSIIAEVADSTMITEENLEDSITNTTIDTAVFSDYIHVSDQVADETVAVALVTLETNGWVVVHEEQNGFIGNALGAKRKDAGTYTGVTIPLLRSTTAGARYWIVLYSDNDDRQFNLTDDFPLRDSAENPITSHFLVQ